MTEAQLEAAAALVAVTDALSLAACGGIATLGWSGMAPLAGGKATEFIPASTAWITNSVR